MAKLNKTNTMKGRHYILAPYWWTTYSLANDNNNNNNNDDDDDIELFFHSNSPLIYQISEATSHMME